MLARRFGRAEVLLSAEGLRFHCSVEASIITMGYVMYNNT